MTFLLGEVARFLAATVGWLALVTAVGIAAAFVVGGAHRERPGRAKILAAIVGAAVGAAIAHRLGLPGPETELWDRPLPLPWAGLGALAASEIHLRLRHRPKVSDSRAEG